MPDRIRLEDLRAVLTERKTGFGAEVLLLDETASTNDDAREWAKRGAPHGALVLAEGQSAGRGRNDHVWHSPKGENVYLSVILRPKLEPALVPALSIAVGLSVARAIEGLSDIARARGVFIKWPNDVWVLRKKISGVLMEAQFRGADLSHVIAGIGVNVHSRCFPQELQDSATSLALLGTRVSRATVVATVCFELERALSGYEGGGLSNFMEELAIRDALLGREVTGLGLSGCAAGIDAEGRLRLADSSGSIRFLHSGEAREVRVTESPERREALLRENLS